MKKKRFINLSNHPVKCWSPKQLAEAQAYGEILEIAFPPIDPCWTKEHVEQLVSVYIQKICDLEPAVVMVQGEYGFTFEIVRQLKAKRIVAVYACTERNTSEEINENGQVIKISKFKFIQFREY